MLSAKEVLSIAIQLEENAESLYRKDLAGIRNEAVRELLEWLAAEEARHRKLFVDMQRAIQQPGGEAWLDQVGRLLLQDAVGGKALTLEETDFGAIADERELLVLALKFEEDSIAFYEIIQSVLVEPEMCRHLDEIIVEERKHVQVLSKRLQELSV